jgi:hypothetical protein
MPSPDEIDWNALSDRSLQTLARIALPISAGLTHAEVARQLGVSEATVGARMGALRRELREQADGRA